MTKCFIFTICFLNFFFIYRTEVNDIEASEKDSLDEYKSTATGQFNEEGSIIKDWYIATYKPDMFKKRTSVA